MPAISATALTLPARRAASSATAAPSLCPASAMRFGSMSLRFSRNLTTAMTSSA